MHLPNTQTSPSTLRTASGNSGLISLRDASLAILGLDLTAIGGTNPTLDVYWDRYGADGVAYQAYHAAQKTAAGQVATSIGIGMEVDTPLGEAGRLRWVLGGTGVATTSGATANSATQQVASTAGMIPGMTLHFGTANVDRVIASITDATHVVLTAAVSATNTEAITSATPAAQFSWSVQADA